MLKKRKLILIFCVLFLASVPFLWNRGSFRVGGDDGKLYYLFPFEQISYYKDSIVSDNLAGSLGAYFPIQFIIPFFVFIGAIKNIFFFFDTQSFLFGINLATGFLFFYLLLGLFIKDDKWDSFYIRIFSGLFYVFSIFTFYTIWNVQLISVFWYRFFL